MSESKSKKEPAQEQPAGAPEPEVASGDVSLPQAKVAVSLAQAITPVIARELISGKVSFVALTVVVDDKYGTTFPYYPFVPESATDTEKFEIKVKTAKADMLAAIESAKAAARFKHKSIQALEEGFFDPSIKQ